MVEIVFHSVPGLFQAVVAAGCIEPTRNHMDNPVDLENKKQAVFTMMDEFSRYEIDVQITDETAEMEIALESTWMRCFGFPTRLRMDASGPHQGQVFADWC